MPNETEFEFVERITGNLEDLIIEQRPDTIAAFIVEPIRGASGVIVPPLLDEQVVPLVVRQ